MPEKTTNGGLGDLLPAALAGTTLLLTLGLGKKPTVTQVTQPAAAPAPTVTEAGEEEVFPSLPPDYPMPAGETPTGAGEYPPYVPPQTTPGEGEVTYPPYTPPPAPPGGGEVTYPPYTPPPAPPYEYEPSPWEAEEEPEQLPEEPPAPTVDVAPVVNAVNRLVYATLLSLDEARIKNLLTLIPTAEVRSYMLTGEIRVSAGISTGVQKFPQPGYRFLFLGPVEISADYYSRDVKFTVGLDGYHDPYSNGQPIALVERMTLPIPPSFFERGTYFSIMVDNQSSNEVYVFYRAPVVEVEANFYSAYIQPLMQRALEALKTANEWLTTG